MAGRGDAQSLKQRILQRRRLIKKFGIGRPQDAGLAGALKRLLRRLAANPLKSGENGILRHEFKVDETAAHHL